MKNLKKDAEGVVEVDAACSEIKVDQASGPRVTSFNRPDMDVRSASHEVAVSQANICSKTCNAN